MVQALNRLRESPSQTAGPYVHIGCVPNFCGIDGVYPADPGAAMVTERTRGRRITISGTVIDGTGTALRDAMVEIWQADADGLYANDPRGPGDAEFTGWGRRAGDYRTGEWVFETIKPGRVPFPDGRMQAPHILYNVGNHTPVPLAELIAAIEAATGRKAEQHPVAMQPGDVRATYAEVERLSRVTGFAPSTPLASGIGRFVAWYRGYYG